MRRSQFSLLEFLSKSRIFIAFIPPMADAASKPAITIREMQSYEDLRQVESVEKEIWGLADKDVLPTTMTVASKEAGSVWIGAFDGQKLIGFAFGILGLEMVRSIFTPICWACCPNTAILISATNLNWHNGNVLLRCGFAIAVGATCVSAK